MSVAPVLPVKMAPRPPRAPAANIPPTSRQRENLREAAHRFILEKNLAPPLGMEAIEKLTLEFCKKESVEEKFQEFTSVLINNEVWRESFSDIPFEKRLLLLPKCLRDEERCSAVFDELGLLCNECHLCSIEDLQNEAEKLGYAVLVAEGSAVVMTMIKSGQIEAIVGVSCLSVLKKTFPFMEAAAIPGLAIPLLQDDCKNTQVDMTWIWESMHHYSVGQSGRINIEELKGTVKNIFTTDSLNEIMGQPHGPGDDLAREWLCRGGKYWRPLLCASTAKALQGSGMEELDPTLKKLCVAVECFHKASLIHDDIEDEDDERYGQKTMHNEVGIAQAINAGDLLIGEGYRLISELDIDAEKKVNILGIASRGHKKLCDGQGMELDWVQQPTDLSSAKIIEIFSGKTAPAFAVAICTGAVLGGAPQPLVDSLDDFSTYLGIAYQVQDDMDDFESEVDSDMETLRPSIHLGVLYEKTSAPRKERFLELAKQKQLSTEEINELKSWMVEHKVSARVLRILDSHREKASQILRGIENSALKSLLFRVMGKLQISAGMEGICNDLRGGQVESATPPLAK